MNLNEHRKRLNRNRRQEAKHEMVNVGFVRLVGIIAWIVNSYWKGCLTYVEKPSIADTSATTNAIKPSTEAARLRFIGMN